MSDMGMNDGTGLEGLSDLDPDDQAALFPSGELVQSPHAMDVNNLGEQTQLEAALARLQGGIDQNASNLNANLDGLAGGEGAGGEGVENATPALPDVQPVDNPEDPYAEDWDVEEMNERHAEYIQGVEAAAAKVAERGAQSEIGSTAGNVLGAGTNSGITNDLNLDETGIPPSDDSTPAE